MTTLSFKEFMAISDLLDQEELQEGAVTDAIKGGLEALAKKLGVSVADLEKKKANVVAARRRAEQRRNERLAGGTVKPQGTVQARRPGVIDDEDLDPDDRRVLARMDRYNQR
jgi:hypothetical protein